MKYINLIIVLFFVNTLACQISASDSLVVQLSPVTVVPDTSSGDNKMIEFTITIQQVQHLKFLDLSVLDQNDALVLQIGSYDLKTHPTGFYYIETSKGEKKTVLGEEVFFTVTLTQPYDTRWKIKLNYTSNTHVLRSVTSSIAR